MLDASRAFDPYNHAALDDPRIRVVESDGRNFLEYTADTYDVIVSEPSNPWIAGVASLFTKEHFERARNKLAPGGVFCQWVQLYELRPENVARVMKTFRTAFPHALAFSSQPKGTDLILIGSEEPIVLTADGLATAFADPSVRSELARASIHRPDDIYALLFLGEEEMGAFIARQEETLGHEIIINTDDNGILEFEAPKDLVRYTQADAFFAGIYYSDVIYGDPRPHIPDLDSPRAWSAPRLAQLAAASFAAGKQRLGGELAQLALERGESRLARGVLFASKTHRQGPTDPAILAIWEPRDPAAAKVFHAAIAQGSHLAGAQLFYADFPHDDDIFADPEVTLATAWLLHRTKRYKLAHRQLTTLAKDPAFARTHPALHLMLGWSYTKRLRYREAFAAFLTYVDHFHRGE
jgi:hypothetical protein